jgi:endonuclease YncB( thermonuclease family)
MTWIIGIAPPFGYSILVSDVRVSFRRERAEFQHDCLQKIYRIGPSIIGGFAGSEEIGFRILGILTEELSQAPPRHGWSLDVIGIRINGIDTPEMRDNRPHIKALARKAKQYTVQRLRESHKIILRNIQRGKYFRIVADVYVDGSSLGQELISAGLAKPYDGGKKPKWE